MKNTNKIRILIATMFLSVFFISLPSVVNAENRNSSFDLYQISNELQSAEMGDVSRNNISRITDTINNLSDQEFDRFIIDLIKNSQNMDNLKSNLKSIGVELKYPDSGYGLYAVGAYDAQISVTAARRGSESFYRLLAYPTLSKSESRPGSYDVITVYFDSNKANYFSYSESSNTSLRNGQYATSGTVVFNLYDGRMGTSSEYVGVYITPNSSGRGQWIDFGADWTHTYTKTEISEITPSAELKFEGKGVVGGSVGVNVTIDPSVEYQWTKASTNAFRSY